MRGVGFAVRDDGLDRLAQIDLLDVLGADVGVEAQCLLAHLFHQIGAHDSFAESGEVFDFGGGHEGATELGSLEEEGRELSTRGVDTSGVAGRSGTDNDDVMDRGRDGHSVSFTGSNTGSVGGQRDTDGGAVSSLIRLVRES